MKKIDINKLINKAKASNTKKAIQKVVPISINIDEIQFSFYIDKILLRKLKLRALNENESIKSIITKSIEMYLTKE
jgi:hypothetical protein